MLTLLTLVAEADLRFFFLRKRGLASISNDAKTSACHGQKVWKLTFFRLFEGWIAESERKERFRGEGGARPSLVLNPIQLAVFVVDFDVVV